MSSTDMKNLKNLLLFLMLSCLSFQLYAAKQDETMSLTLTSSAFSNSNEIPRQHTCDGRDLPIPLQWSGAPENTVSFVLIMDDPDAPVGTWDHWLLFNIPKEVSQIKENTTSFSDGTMFGANSWGRSDYGGPCPPDKRHRYFFKLYALDTKLNLPQGASKKQILSAIDGHVLADASLMGTYDRPR